MPADAPYAGAGSSTPRLRDSASKAGMPDAATTVRPVPAPASMGMGRNARDDGHYI